MIEKSSYTIENCFMARNINKIMARNLIKKKYNLLSGTGDTRNRAIIVADDIDGNGLLVCEEVRGLNSHKKRR